jgi:hypothetical protein
MLSLCRPRMGRLGDFGIGEAVTAIGSAVIQGGATVGAAELTSSNQADAQQYVAKENANAQLAQTLATEQTALRLAVLNQQGQVDQAQIQSGTTTKILEYGGLALLGLGILAFVVTRKRK